MNPVMFGHQLGATKWESQVIILDFLESNGIWKQIFEEKNRPQCYSQSALLHLQQTANNY